MMIELKTIIMIFLSSAPTLITFVVFFMNIKKDIAKIQVDIAWLKKEVDSIKENHNYSK